ncbi:cytochrome-c peroxidase [Roseateles koreensis]|uniref:Cytochrome c peroxidase n=1 Tax=Roseateles koreensis TaxID=2987526 RepID=A0ABT5KUH2_9BURK|nr:cytochrome c peroxidase [Roseateles koreensis]MDC8786085.1 cytochrome c peroxidase [Roseateles koreensis]
MPDHKESHIQAPLFNTAAKALKIQCIAYCALLLAACGGGDAPTRVQSESTSAGRSALAASPHSAPSTPPLSLSAQVGQKLFFDASLSASGAMSCATCHDPQHAYGPPNARAVQLGGPKLNSAGLRAVPSLRYKLATPAYSNEQFDPDGAGAPAPGGGFTWDGRANSLAEQAALPLLSPLEMANASPEAVVKKVQAGAYAPLFLQAFGPQAFANGATAFANITAALQAFQKEDPSFRPYSSKFDLYNQRGLGKLSTAELRGKAVFNDPNSGNCAACHLPDLNQFTDHLFAAIGPPRNSAIPANAILSYMDLGLCGPARRDLKPAHAKEANPYCGMFKTPTLRNVATRSVFFHNGVITSLEQAIRFYNTRDTNPEIWYPTVGGKPVKTPSADFPTYGLITQQYRGGKVQKFNDLPAKYHANIDTQMPQDGRKAGSKPPLSEQNIADLLCFLKTLTDDYVAPASEPSTGPCVN